MNTSVNLFSMKKGEILKFLKLFYDYSIEIEDDLHWKKVLKILLKW